MDNVCHTLVGAALADAGLSKRTRLGGATLMIAANIPDIDVLVFATNVPSVAFRRGWTHGVLAQALLPVLLTAVMTLIGRTRQRNEADPPLSVPWLLALSYVGVYSHVLLDYLNNYGVRLLSPVSWRWWYGDTLFIVDIWLWLVLGAGVWLARRARSPRAVRGALLVAACYIALMLFSAGYARTVVFNTWRDVRGQQPRALMVGPLPVTPFRRAVIVDAGDRYETGTFSWWDGRVTFDSTSIPKNTDLPLVQAARRAPPIDAFLVWSRFPYWTVESVPEGTRVSVRDMRFGGAIGSRFAVSVVLPRGSDDALRER